MTVSRETFEAWRAPRFGSENPTRMDNPLWASLVHERLSAYEVNERHGGAQRRGPTWCFLRFGQTATPLDDGRTLYLAGEHEDSYDPDFYIYNDVVIVAPDGAVAIYGYPRAVFPPTDFHTATRAGDQLWIVGSLGYADARAVGTTQVCCLDLTTLAIAPVATTGQGPGWIHKHAAELAGGAIVVRGGLVETGAALDENIDDWALDLATRTWTRRTTRDWQRWAVRRADGGRSHLWELRQMKWVADHPHLESSDTFRDGVVAALRGEPDLALIDTLYRAEGAHAIEQRDDEYNVWRVELDGVIVRFTEEPHRIAAMVEGRLAAPRLDALQAHVVAQLSALHFTAWEVEP